MLHLILRNLWYSVELTREIKTIIYCEDNSSNKRYYYYSKQWWFINRKDSSNFTVARKPEHTIRYIYHVSPAAD